MGIRDRDYMKRPSDAGDRHSPDSDSKLEQFFADFLARHPRLPWVISIVLAILIAAALLAAKFSR